jgi:hypothetical protein
LKKTRKPSVEKVGRRLHGPNEGFNDQEGQAAQKVLAKKMSSL